MTRLKDWLDEAQVDPDVLTADGFDNACLGLSCGFGPQRAVYDWDKCVDILMTRDGMTADEAIAYMDFNVTGAYVGEHTPEFILARPQAAAATDNNDTIVSETEVENERV